jgi:TrmH family RNA methyltransferase
VLPLTARNARFQQWQALLTNRTKRQRAGEFVVQGVRPISLAVKHGWRVRSLLVRDGGPDLSSWARGVLDSCPGAAVFAVAPELLGELAGKSAEDGVPELVAIVALPPDSLDRIPRRPEMTVVVFDRPTSPGNIGTLVRSADAFGAAGVIVTGHAADPYDPRAVRASTGSLFALPVVRCSSPAQVLEWAPWLRVVGADEGGEVDAFDFDLSGPTLLLIGNETRGLSAAWRERCDVTVRIPIGGAASSLNAAEAATVLMYESARQRATGRLC